MQECRDCRHEIALHWQFCAHCGIRLATTAQATATRCPRSVRMPVPGVACSITTRPALRRGRGCQAFLSLVL